MSGQFTPSDLRRIPNPGGHSCFGCGCDNAAGLRMEFATDGVRVVSRLTVPPHLCGWDGVVHGGVVATVLDEIMSWAAIALLKRYILTRSMQVDFLRPVAPGKELRAEGRVGERSGEREALMRGELYDDEGNLCAAATGRFALFTRDAIERLGIFERQTLDAFERFLSS